MLLTAGSIGSIIFIFITWFMAIMLVIHIMKRSKKHKSKRELLEEQNELLRKIADKNS